MPNTQPPNPELNTTPNQSGANQTNINQTSSEPAANKSKLLLILGLLGLVVIVGAYLMARPEPTPEPIAPPELVTEEEFETTLETLAPPLEQTDLAPIDETIQPPVGEETNLLLTSSQQSYQVGDTIEVTLLMQAHVLPDGVEYRINFQPELVEQISIAPINSFGTFLANRVNDETGQIVAMLIREPGEEVDISQPIPLLKIAAIAKQPGTLTFSFDPDMVLVAAAGGQSVLKNAYDLSITIE